VLSSHTKAGWTAVFRNFLKCFMHIASVFWPQTCLIQMLHSFFLRYAVPWRSLNTC